jgi:type I restriction enzyme, S subunit
MSEWKETTLGNVINLKRGYDLPESQRLEGGIPIYSSSGISGFHNSCKCLSPGVITGRYGTIGKVFLSNTPFWPLNTTLYVQDFKDNDEVFIYYFLNKIDWTKFNDKSAVPGVNRNDLHQEDVLLPPLAEQKKIADLLSCLDAKIDNLRRQNETLEEIARSIFKHWFIDFEFPNADGKPYKSSGGAMVRSDLGDIPEGWQVGKLSDYLSLIIDYRGKTPKKLDCDWSMDGIPALSAKNIKNGKILVEQLVHFADEALYQKWMKDELQKGDILLTSEAPLGEVYYLASDSKYILSQRLFCLRTKKEFSSSYLYFWLRSPEGQNLINRRATGSTVQGIRQSELRNVEVIIPNGELLENASDLWMSILGKIEANYQAINIITKTRDDLLPKLMSGQLRVKE